MSNSKQNSNPYSQTVHRSRVQNLHEELDEPEAVLVNAESLKCPTCLEYFREAPVMLKCGHSFCQTCLQELKERRTTSRSFPCPICRTDSSFLETKNYAVGTIVDSVDRYTDAAPSSSQACQNLKFKNEQLRDQLSRTEKKKEEEEVSPWAVGALGAVAGAIGMGLLWAFTSGHQKRRDGKN